MKAYFKDHGEQLFKLGYLPFPIAPGAKTPFLDKGESWTDEITLERVQGWALNGKGIGGIGLRNVFGLDFDVHHLGLAQTMAKRIKAEIITGDNFMFRVGESPKFLVPAGPGSEIEKKEKHTWYWPDGSKEELELLPPGESHYWVAYGHHPCGADYTWLNGEVLKTHINDLPVLDGYDIAGIIDIFEEECVKLGLTQDKPITVPKPTEHSKIAEKAASHPLLDIKTPTGMSLDNIKRHLDVLPPEMCNNRDDWVKVGAAIHFETQGSDDGFELFDDWSRGSSKYAGEKDTRGRWDSFSLSKTGRSAATMASIIKAGIETVTDEQRDVFVNLQTAKTDSYEDRVRKATNREELRAIMLDVRQDKKLDRLAIGDLAGIIKKQALVLGITWTVSDIKGEMRPKIRSMAVRGLETAPEWVNPWVFLANQDKFSIPGSTIAYTRSVFNGLYGRHLADMEMATGNDDLPGKPDIYALDIARIMTVHDQMYNPAAGDTFTFEGFPYVNTYSPDSHGDRKPMDQWTETDKRNVALYEAHIRTIFNEDGEADVIINTLCHIAQQGAKKRLEWMLILKGCEGDGKTLILTALARCMGERNSGIINAEEITEHHFTEWAHGHLFKTVEELKVPSQNRHAVVNKQKPYITNPVISIHPKGRKAFKALNTASYIATTNHFDCLPISEESRRYAITRSQFQTKAEVYKTLGKDYFDILFHALDESADALNEWLCTRPIPDDFSAYNAPYTSSMDDAIAMNATEEDEAIKDIIDSGEFFNINNKVVDTKALTTALEMSYGITIFGKTVEKVMGQLGYRRVPWKIKISGEVRTVWVKGVKIKKDDRPGMNAIIRNLMGTPF